MDFKQIDENSFEATLCERVNGTSQCFNTRVELVNPETKPNDGRFRLVFLSIGLQLTLAVDVLIISLINFVHTDHKPLEHFRFITDYENFGIAYSCKNLNDGAASEEFFWLATKDLKPSEEVQSHIDDILTKNFEKSAFKEHKHKEKYNCDYAQTVV
jgi:hypothetical protein